ncbi:MAG TPA: DsbA family protein [Terricaulis sp.]|nr:DsbA family protein [Terricaulis sp.]
MTQPMHMLSSLSRALVLAPLAALALSASAAAQSFNAQEQAEIRALVREYLVRNPDVLREALDSLETRVNAERWEQVRADSRDFAIGPADAPVVIVEFFDYRCTYCHAALEWVVRTQASRRDVRFVMKELPILSDQSFEAAQASLAARPQGRYWQFHRALMGFRGELTSQRIDELARQSGIDVARMRREMESPEIMAHLQDNRARAVEYGINGTPGFIINGELISGYDEERLNERVRQAAIEARERRAAQR